MQQPLRSEEIRTLVNVQLITGGRHVPDEEHRRFLDQLEDADHTRRDRAPKPTPAFLRRLNIRMRKGGEPNP